MAILLGILCLMLVIWSLESQRTRNADEKAVLVVTFRGTGGCTYDKRKNGKINMGVNFGGNLVSKRVTGVGLLIVILLLLTSSVRTLKIEDEEGNILYDDKMDLRSGELVEVDPRVHGIPGRVLWNVAGFLGRGVRDWILSPPPVPEKPQPELLKADLVKELEDISTEIKDLRDSMTNIQVDMSVIKATEEGDERKIEFTPEELEELINPLGFLKKYDINPEDAGMGDYDSDVSEKERDRRREARKEIIEEKKKDLKEGQEKKGNQKKELIEEISKKYIEVLKNLEKKVKDLNNQTALESGGCHTLKCCMKVIMESMFEFSWMALSDPMCFFIRATEYVATAFDGQFQTVRSIIGFCISFTVLNGIFYVVMKANELYEKAKKLTKKILGLPLVTVGIRLVKGGTQWLIKGEDKKGISAEEERKIGEEVKKEMENKMEEKLKVMTEAMKKIKDELKRVPRAEIQQKCSYCGSSTHNIKNCPLRMAEVNRECAYCGKRGHFAYECLIKKQDEEKGIKPWQGMIGSWSSCRYCGRRGHKESECRIKQRDEMLKKGPGPSNWQAQKPPLFPKPPKPPPRNVNTVDNRENSNERKRSVYAPIQLDGIKFSRCLIDTGSQVNLIPKADVTRNQFVVSKNDIKEIYGFNGIPGQILGTVTGDLKLGPNKEPQKASFMVSSEITTPIIGFPTLRDFGLSINCQKHEIVNEQTGESVFCSVLLDEKN